MAQKFFVSPAGKYLGSFDGAAPPVGAIEVATPPVDASEEYRGGAWEKPVDPSPKFPQLSPEKLQALLRRKGVISDQEIVDEAAR